MCYCLGCASAFLEGRGISLLQRKILFCQWQTAIPIDFRGKFVLLSKKEKPKNLCGCGCCCSQSSSSPIAVKATANLLLQRAMAEDVRCCEPEFWLYMLAIVGLVTFAGLMAGLTLGLMSLGLVDLEVLIKSGRPQDRKHAGNLYYHLPQLWKFISYLWPETWIPTISVLSLETFQEHFSYL